MGAEPRQRIVYPESDGMPMAETDVHRDEAVACVAMLRWHFRNEPDVYVAGNNFLYWEEGNPRAVVSPDVYVVRGVPKGQRRTFKVWEEKGRTPCFVMELSSRSTWLEDHGNKKVAYEMLGVTEYVLFDPEADCLDPPMQLHRLGDDGHYQRVEPNEDGALTSNVLGLTLWLDDLKLRARDDTAGMIIPRPEEAYVERARFEAHLAEQDTRLAEQAARIAALEAQLAEREEP